jgi:hypothetical protein
MSVRVANITDEMTKDDRILELLICMRSNLNELDKVIDRTDTLSVKLKLALKLQLEAQVSRAILYAST